MTQPDSQSLKQHVVLFTGKLAVANRRQATRWVEQAGGSVREHFTKKVALVVVGFLGWSMLADGRLSQKLLKAQAAQRKGQPLEIISEPVFLQRIGRLTVPPQAGTLTLKQAANLLKVSETDLQHWEQRGLVQFEAGRVSFQDLVSLRNLVKLIQQGVTLQRICKTLVQLQQVLPDMHRPLAQARLLQGAGNDLVVELQGAHIDTQGQLLFDFEGPPDPAQTSLFTSHKISDTTSMFADAVEYEQQGDWTSAENLYRQIVELTSDHVEAWLNLGNTLREQYRYEEAIAAYRKAIALDEGHVLAWYNLGYCLDEQAQLQEAAQAFLTATELAPQFSDALFNLARCYERLGKHQQAVPYWQAYLALDPDSEWSKVACRFVRL